MKGDCIFMERWNNEKEAPVGFEKNPALFNDSDATARQN